MVIIFPKTKAIVTTWLEIVILVLDSGCVNIPVLAFQESFTTKQLYDMKPSELIVSFGQPAVFLLGSLLIVSAIL